MPIATRTFRVFVSSTFEDLKEERNALQSEVFPKLQELCEAHGARFQAIDLRWGVREEAAADQRTMGICLTEIERCQKTGMKPNFIVLLGERYGWRPVPARISAAEFARVRGPLADSWYQRDDNAVPPEYLLKPRTGDFPEAQLHRELRDAARAAGLPEKEMVKYEASATHQEVLKGLGEKSEEREHVLAFFRGGAVEDSDLANLKALLPNSVEYAAGDLAKLCKNVRVRLKRIIWRQIRGFESRPALLGEVAAHNKFAGELTRRFVGRAAVLNAIREYVSGDDRRPLVLHGSSGSGKSTVMARASGGDGVIRRFVGATPESSDPFTLLRGLCQQMGVPEPGLDLPSVAKAFRECLSSATAERPLVLYIDALEQLANVTWLPSQLPRHCRMVVSTTDAIDGAQVVELDAMPPEEASELLKLWLEDARRVLGDKQRRKLLESFGRCGLPLYLKLAFEEARRWRSFDEGVLGEGITGIIDVLLNRLSDDRNHGAVLVRRALGFLAVARYGLTEGEMLDVLSEDQQVWKDFSERAKHTPPLRRLPVVVWSRLFFDLYPYLTERAVPGGPVMTWYHRQVGARVTERYMKKREASARHKALARHFVRLHALQPNANLRKLSELPYHQTLAGLWDAVERTLSDLEFAEAKIAANMLHDLIQDCDRVLGKHEKPGVKVMRKVLALALPALSQRPELALQTLYNQLAWIPESGPGWQRALRAAETRLNSRSVWLRAEGPLPGAETGVVFEIASARQFLRQSEGLIVAVARDGEVETREVASGSLVARRQLGVTGIRDATAMPIGDRVAWIDNSGVLHAEGTDHVLARQRADTRPVWHTRGCIVSVISDNSLVAWDPDDGHIAVLLSNVPSPLRVLKSSSDRRSLLLAAGKMPHLLVLLTAEETGWQSREIPWDYAPIVDADWDTAVDLLLVVCEDRRLRIAKLFSGRITEDLAYERWPQPQIMGRPRRCALVVQDAVTRAFFVTDRGHTAYWEPARRNVVRMQDYGLSGLFVFEALAGSTKLYVSDGNGGTVAHEYSESRGTGGIVRHKNEVDSCAFSTASDIVSACYRESIIMWSSCDLRLSHVTVIPGLTAMATVPGSDSIVAGDTYGRVCRVSAGQPGGSGQILGPLALDEAVRCVVCDGPIHAIASDSHGRVVRVPLNSEGPQETLRIGGQYREQIDLLSAGPGGKYWSLTRDSTGGGQRESVLSLLDRSGQETVLVSSVRDLNRIAATEDGSRLCVFGYSVRVLQRTQLGLEEQYRRDTAAFRVAFLCAGEFLAVVPPGRCWVEIWRVTDGLPVVGFCYLQRAIECLATAKNRVVAGLVSGELASLTMAGTSVSPPAGESDRAAQRY